MIIDVSQTEKETGILQPDKLNAVCGSIGHAGFAVISNLISDESCDLLAESVLVDADIIGSTGITPHERRTGQGHLQLGLRRYAPYVRSDLVANPLIEQVVSAVLGPGAWLGFYNGNVNCPGSSYQPLHFDRPFSWKTPEQAAEDGKTWPPPTTTLSCSVALTEINVDNGATEIYPGTHHETAVTRWQPGERPANYPDLVETWGPPKKMEIPAGGICFRDPRMWHRGVPNNSDTARPMIALTYHTAAAKHWRGLLNRNMGSDEVERCQNDSSLRFMDDGKLGDGRLVFHTSAEPAFNRESVSGVERNVRFVDEPFAVNHFVDAHMVGGARVTTGSITPDKAIESKLRK